ncbi:MAG: 2Fe-2S iron-sulfur cluster binding domain-containing protein [Acidobacteria bacterium]|nr:2Fe-2S iron-sulfur cluster binding domain-containing protein [Acidobacteriota bacterium]
MSSLNLNVNGRPLTVDVDPTTPLLYVLRNDLQLRGPQFGCGLGQCGACTVIMDGRAARSCITPVSKTQGLKVVTLEGLGTVERPHPIQRAADGQRDPGAVWKGRQADVHGPVRPGEPVHDALQPESAAGDPAQHSGERRLLWFPRDSPGPPDRCESGSSHSNPRSQQSQVQPDAAVSQSKFRDDGLDADRHQLLLQRSPAGRDAAFEPGPAVPGLLYLLPERGRGRRGTHDHGHVALGRNAHPSSVPRVRSGAVRVSRQPQFREQLDVRASVGPAAHRGAESLLGGWQINGILTLSSGFPFTVEQGTNAATGILGHQRRPDLLPGKSNNPVLGGPDRYYDPTVFQIADPQLYGNLGRNTVIGPGVATFDFSLGKDFRVKSISEDFTVQFKFETFNLFNRANFGQPLRTAFDGTGRRVGAAGRITSTTTSSRQCSWA